MKQLKILMFVMSLFLNILQIQSKNHEFTRKLVICGPVGATGMTGAMGTVGIIIFTTAEQGYRSCIKNNY